MASTSPALAVRGSSGIGINYGPPSYEVVPSFPKINTKNCKAMAFSPNGQFFSWFDGLKIEIVDTADWSNKREINSPKTAGLTFSPKGTYLISWEPFIVNSENPKGSPNLHFWKSTDGSLVHEFIHKKQISWQPQWSNDEKICGRIVDGEVLIYEKHNFNEPQYKIQNPKVNEFSISPTVSTYHVITYMPGSTGPCFGRMFKHPRYDHDSCVANKTFFKADNVDMYWNSKGTNVLLLASTEVDKSSYYGKQSLHFMSTKGQTAIVLLNKEGPIYDIKWNPNGDEFCVMYGFMPSKATLYNTRCEIVFDYGTAHRNCIYYNLHGNILLLGGFGNISGKVEAWDAINQKKISSFSIPDTTFLQWSPDGIHFVTATTAPRLRVGNGYKIWHYSGALLYERPWNKQEELWEVSWQTFPEGYFKKPTVSFKHIEGIQSTVPTVSKEAYRPPCARNLPPSANKFNLHDEVDTPQTKPLSKAALKVKKKRENKRQAKLLQQQSLPENPADGTETNAVVKNGHSENNESSSPPQNSKNDSDKSAKIKKIKSNLKSIDKLKEIKSSGKELRKDQLEKIKRETELKAELQKLTI